MTVNVVICLTVSNCGNGAGLESRVQLTFGTGLPLEKQEMLTFVPSRTDTVGAMAETFAAPNRENEAIYHYFPYFCLVIFINFFVLPCIYKGFNYFFMFAFIR